MAPGVFDQAGTLHGIQSHTDVEEYHIMEIHWNLIYIIIIINE